MLEIVYSRDFKKDFKREKRGQHSVTVEQDVKELVNLLVNVDETPLPPKYEDHIALGEWKGHRECHLKPDLLVIYRTIGDELWLARLGSHTRLFKKL